MTPRPQSFHDLCFYGPNGALNPSEDLILESRAWRERLFAERSPHVAPPTPFLGARSPTRSSPGCSAAAAAASSR